MEPLSTAEVSLRNGDLELAVTRAQTQMQVVLDFWKEFNLDGRRLQLDKQGLELQDAKDSSLSRRKQLAELTKEFRKKPDNEKLLGFQKLVRAYQEEIDGLSKRCRASDSAFFSLYKGLYEAPDPAQALERYASERPRAAASELEVQKLQAELAEYEAEFSKLKNQDITIRRLEEVIAGYEQGAEDKAEHAAAARIREVQEAAEAAVEASRERGVQLEKSLQDSEDALSEAKAATDDVQARLFDASRKAQEAEAAWEVEREILSQSSEAVQAQLARLEQELQEARRKDTVGSSSVGVGAAAMASVGASGTGKNVAMTASCAAATSGRTRVGAEGGAPGESGTDGGSLSHTDAVEAELAELTRVNTQLRGELVAKEVGWREERETLEAAASALKEKTAADALTLAGLRKEMSTRPTVSEVRSLRQQLRMLQQLEFNADNEGDEDASDTVVSGDETHGADPEHTARNVERTMEQVIRGRVRRLEADLTSSKRLAEERGVENTQLQHSLEAATALSAERLETINKLEEDLASASQSAGRSLAASRGGMSGSRASPTVIVGGGAPFMPLAREESDDAQALRELLGVAGESRGSDEGGNAVGAEAEGTSGRVLGIVQAQRDRFRRRIKDLEAEREVEQREARASQAVMERLQRDNLELYKKVRFLQNYQQGEMPSLSQEDLEAGTGSFASGGRGRGTRMSPSPAESRYSKVYEARINPFTQFSQREKQRKYKELSVAERITLGTTRILLGTKFARNFVFFYVVFLHLVVFFALHAKC